MDLLSGSVRGRLYKLLSLLLVGLWLATPAVAAPVGESPDLVEVMVQAESAEAAAALVHRAGGTVTHELGIINAVGARLTAVQRSALETMAGPGVYENYGVQTAQEPAGTYVLDEFDLDAWNNNDGTIDWMTDWDVDGGGYIYITHDKLLIKDDDHTATRAADLTGATWATLSLEPIRKYI
jgi:hypothetical protein